MSNKTRSEKSGTSFVCLRNEKESHGNNRMTPSWWAITGSNC